MSQPYSQFMTSPPLVTQDKGKGKIKESDFEAAFAQVAASLQPTHTAKEASRIEEITEGIEATQLDDSDHRSPTFKEYVNECSDVGLIGTNGGGNRVWDQMKNSDMPPSDSEMAKWESEFNHMMHEDESYDYGAAMKDLWEKGENDLNTNLRFDEQGIPELKSYEFGKSSLLGGRLIGFTLLFRTREQIYW
jgi:peroxin-5